MNKDSFDKALKQKFSDTATDFDLEASWNALEARRQGSKRRRLIWWFVFGVLLLSGSGLGWWWSSRTVSPVAANTPTSKSHRGPASRPAIALPATDAAAQPFLFKNKKSAKTRSANQNLTSRQPANQTLHTPTLRLQPSSTKFPEVVNTAGEKPMPTPLLKNTAVISNNFSVQQPVAGGANFTPLPQQINLLQIPLRDFPESTVLLATAEKRKAAKDPKWSIGLQAGYGLQAVARKGASDYVQARKQEEQSLDLILAGLELRRQLNKRWFVQSGIQYAQWTDVRRRHQESSSSRPDSNLLLRQIKYPDGSIENIYGPGEVTVVQTREETRYNKYRQLEVPVMVGATLPLGQHWRLEFSTGLALGLLSRTSGSATVGGQETQLSALPYRNAGTLAFQSRFACLYQTPRWSAGLALLGRTDLFSSTTSNAPFSEKRSSFGLGILLLRPIR